MIGGRRHAKVGKEFHKPINELMRDEEPSG